MKLLIVLGGCAISSWCTLFFLAFSCPLWGTATSHKGGVTFNIYNNCKLVHAYVLLVDNTPANISNALVAPAAKNAPVYNLAGQQVNASYKGVVIKNGKKYVQK